MSWVWLEIRMPSRKILLALTILGLRNPYKRARTEFMKHTLYCSYISLFIVLLGFRIRFSHLSYMGYQLSSLLNLVDGLGFFVNFCGIFLVYLESFFYRQELDLILEKFAEIDGILLKYYKTKIDDLKIDRFFMRLSSFLMFLLMINGILLTIGMSLFMGLTLPFTQIVLATITLKFWFICQHLIVRFVKLRKFFSSNGSQIGEIQYKVAQKIVIRTARIILLTNKYFQFKFIFIISNINLCSHNVFLISPHSYIFS